jgi:hypothetical protein
MLDAESVDVALSTVDTDAFRSWKRNRPHKTGTWFKRLNFYQTPGHVEPIKSLLDGVNQLTERIIVANAKIERWAAVDWSSVEAQRPWYERLGHTLHHFGKWMYAKFRAMLDSLIPKCESDQVGLEKRAVSAAGVNMEELEKTIARDGAGQEEQVIAVETLLGKAESATENIDEGSKTALMQLGEHVNNLRRLEESARAGNTSKEQLAINIEAVHAKTCEGLLGMVTRKVNGFLSQLKAILNGVKKGVKAVASVAVPEIGVRGLGTFLGPRGFGIEEVVDFRHREIGYFGWGSGGVGTSSVGVSLGGYAGFGWKGYKRDWDLQEAYQTAMFTSHSVTLPIPVAPSIGVTFAMDADNSRGDFSLWTPDPTGLDGITFGWGLSVSLLNLGIIGRDVGQALYRYITSVCFDSMRDFVKALTWNAINPLTWFNGGAFTKCTKKEKVLLHGIRILTHLAGGIPLLTELMFWALAVYNDWKWSNWQAPNSTSKGIERKCSLMSTRSREDVPLMAKTLAKKLQDAVQLIERMRSHVFKFVTRINQALRTNPELLKSKEFRKLSSQKQLGDESCSRFPPQAVSEFASGLGQNAASLPAAEKASKDNPFGSCDRLSTKRKCPVEHHVTCVQGACACESTHCYRNLPKAVGSLKVKVIEITGVTARDSGAIAGDHLLVRMNLGSERHHSGAKASRLTNVDGSRLHTTWEGRENDSDTFLIRDTPSSKYLDIQVITDQQLAGSCWLGVSDLPLEEPSYVTLELQEDDCQDRAEGDKCHLTLELTRSEAFNATDGPAGVCVPRTADDMWKRQFVWHMGSGMQAWIRRRELELGSYVSELKKYAAIEKLRLNTILRPWIRRFKQPTREKTLAVAIRKLPGVWTSEGQLRSYVITKPTGAGMLTLTILKGKRVKAKGDLQHCYKSIRGALQVCCSTTLDYEERRWYRGFSQPSFALSVELCHDGGLEHANAILLAKETFPVDRVQTSKMKFGHVRGLVKALTAFHRCVECLTNEKAKSKTVDMGSLNRLERTVAQVIIKRRAELSKTNVKTDANVAIPKDKLTKKTWNFREQRKTRQGAT